MARSPAAQLTTDELDLSRIVARYADSTPLPDDSRLFRVELQRPRAEIAPLTEAQRRTKRALDVALALAIGILTAPILLLAMLAVRLTSPGRAIYRQKRTGLNERATRPDRRRLNVGPPDGVEDRRAPGRDRRARPEFGRPFEMYKIRTMRVDAEANGACWASADDPRITTVGRFLRKSRIDELPQLWNVLRGDMSFVGPRPERPEFIAKLEREIPGYLDRLGVKPGLTGLAQVVNGYDTGVESVRAKVRLDLIYLQNYSVWNDWKIVLRTVGVVFTGRGAH